MKNFLKAKWLKDHLGDKDLILIDIRYSRAMPEEGQLNYEKGHIPGAYYLSWEDVFLGPIHEHGGYGSLPEESEFKDVFSNLGYMAGKKVVFYGQHLKELARAWFVCKVMGINDVYLLYGGMDEWNHIGGNIETSIPKLPAKTEFDLKVDNSFICDRKCLLDSLVLDNKVVIDVRNYRDYAGVEGDRETGHIEGARHHYWRKNLELGSDINILNPNQLEEHYRYLEDAEEIIVYSGLGLSACVAYLGLSEIGYDARIYLGGLSDWVSYVDGELVQNVEDF
jgi:thiosulfate/3-mercaptopyruvate sulfurtransferase